MTFLAVTFYHGKQQGQRFPGLAVLLLGVNHCHSPLACPNRTKNQREGGAVIVGRLMKARGFPNMVSYCCRVFLYVCTYVVFYDFYRRKNESFNFFSVLKALLTDQNALLTDQNDYVYLPRVITTSRMCTSCCFHVQSVNTDLYNEKIYTTEPEDDIKSETF